MLAFFKHFAKGNLLPFRTVQNEIGCSCVIFHKQYSFVLTKVLTGPDQALDNGDRHQKRKAKKRQAQLPGKKQKEAVG